MARFARVAAALVGPSGLLATPARAEAAGDERAEAAGEIRVQIQCERMSAEERARVEVRILAELRARQRTPGTLELTCESDRILGGWRAGGVVSEARSLSLGQQDDLPEMLMWLASLVLETANDRTEPAAPVPPSPVPPAASASAKPAPVEAARDPGSAPAPEAPPREKTAPRAGPRLSAGGGVAYTHYGRDVQGALGPLVSATALVAPRLGVSLDASLVFATEQPSDLAMFEGAWSLGAEWAPLPWVGVSLGPVLSWAHVSSSRSDSAEGSVTAGLEASLKGQIPAGDFGFYARVGARGLLDERQVSLLTPAGAATVPMIFIPRWYAFFVLGVRYTLVR